MPVIIIFIIEAVLTYSLVRKRHGWKNITRACLVALLISTLIAIIVFFLFGFYFSHFGDAGAAMHATFIAGPLVVVAPVSTLAGLVTALARQQIINRNLRETLWFSLLFGLLIGLVVIFYRR